MIESQWGRGVATHDIELRPIVRWFDAGNRLQATLMDQPGGALTISKYVPLAEWLGADPITIAAVAKPILGATMNDLKRDFPESFAAAPRELGRVSAAQACNCVLLQLPPTEWDTETSTIRPSFDGATVTSFMFTIRDENYAPAKDAAFALFKKKWGEPKAAKTRTGKFIFRDKDPFIGVWRDDGDWSGVVSSGEPF